jgi:hypothetical protein
MDTRFTLPDGGHVTTIGARVASGKILNNLDLHTGSAL